MSASSQPDLTPSEVLSQSQVEQLLAQIAEQENNLTVVKSGGERQSVAKETIQPYDFRHPVFLSAGELRKLRLRHEDFARSLTARLSIYLRLELNLQMSKLQTITYQKFVDGLSNPTHLTLFKVEPLRGICILDVPPRLGLTIVDRLLGGPAHSVAADHDFSDIEMAMLDEAIQVILSEWCNHWVKVEELRPALLGHETNGRFLQTAPHDTILLVLAMEARVGDCLEQIQIAFPCYTLEPLIRKLNQAVEATVSEAAKPAPNPGKWNPQFEDVKVPICAFWENLQLTAREVAHFQPGDIIDLDPRMLGEVRLRLAHVTKFVGQLGTVDGKWAISLKTPFKT